MILNVQYFSWTLPNILSSILDYCAYILINYHSSTLSIFFLYSYNYFQTIWMPKKINVLWTLYNRYFHRKWLDRNSQTGNFHKFFCLRKWALINIDPIVRSNCLWIFKKLYKKMHLIIAHSHEYSVLRFCCQVILQFLPFKVILRKHKRLSLWNNSFES